MQLSLGTFIDIRIQSVDNELFLFAEVGKIHSSLGYCLVIASWHVNLKSTISNESLDLKYGDPRWHDVGCGDFRYRSAAIPTCLVSLSSLTASYRNIDVSD